MLRFDGIYICHEFGLLPDPNAQYWEYGYWDYAPEELHYLRFYEDGLVIESTTGLAESVEHTILLVSKWFNKEAVAVRRGRCSIQGDMVTFATLGPESLTTASEEQRFYPTPVSFQGIIVIDSIDIQAYFTGVDKTFSRKYLFRPDESI